MASILIQAWALTSIRPYRSTNGLKTQNNWQRVITIVGNSMKKLAETWIFLVVATGWLISQQALTQQNSTRLIGRIDMHLLQSELRLQIRKVIVLPIGVRYQLSKSESGITSELVVGVSPTRDAAKQMFAEMSSMIPVMRTTQKGTLPGDQFAFWTGTRGTDGWPHRCLLRRENVVLSFCYDGSAKNALDLARRLDELLVHSNEVAPKVDVVATPPLQLSAPRTIRQGSHARIVVSTSGEELFWLNTNEGALAKSGDFYYHDTGRLGNHEISILMASEGNVVFTKTVSIEVLSPKEFDSRRRTLPWRISDSLEIRDLYFLQKPNVDWSKLPSSQKEWFSVQRGTFGIIQSQDEIDRLKQQALKEWGEVLNGDWLPESDLITVERDARRPTPQEYVAHSAFVLQGKSRVIFMGQLGRGCWVYVEQPDPLPAGATPVTAKDLLKPEVFQAGSKETAEGIFPPHEVMTRVFHRYRALKPEGPYEPVRILLMKWREPGELNLRSPGYP